MNKITATGRLAADSELRFTNGGDPILSFRIGSDIGYGANKTTNWFPCQIWGKRAEGLQPHLLKGQQVTVFGSLTLREWTNKEGVKQISPDIRVDEVVLMGAKSAGTQEGETYKNGLRQPAAQTGNSQFADMDDDIPFN